MNAPLNDAPLQQVSSLNAFDWVLIVILSWSVIAAFLRGFIRELFSLAGIVLGIPIAAWNYTLLAPHLEPWLPSPAVARISAFLLIAIGCMLLCSLAGRILRGTARTLGIGFLDRLAGALFGLVRGSLIAVAVLMAAAAFLPQPQLLLAQSRFAPYFLAAAREVSFVVPQDLQKRIVTGVSQIVQGASTLGRR